MTAPAASNKPLFEAAAPAKLPTRHCLDTALLVCDNFLGNIKLPLFKLKTLLALNHKPKGLHQLELQILQMTVSLSPPSHPRT